MVEAKTVGANIRRLRESRQMSVFDLVIAARVPEPLVRRYEAGSHRPGVENAARLADALGVSIDALLREEN